MTPSDLVIVGGGPAGLAAAIGAKKIGLTYRVFEKGALVNSLLRFPTNMVFFTTPELLELGGLPFVTPYEKPTRVEALRYYRRVVDSCQIEIEFGEEVVGVTREKVGSDGVDRFGVETRSAHGTRRVSQTRAVVLTTGCYDHPNLVGVPGEDLPHVSHYYTEPHAYYRKQVVVVGGKNSAAEAALDLYRAGAYVTLVHRRAQLGDSIKYWVRPDIENRIKEGTVAARFETSVVENRADGGRHRVQRRSRYPPRRRCVPVDRLSCGQGSVDSGRCASRSGDLRTGPRSRDARNERVRGVRGGGYRHGRTQRPDFHRERPVSR